MGRRTKDLTGQQFGKLTVIERVENAINGEAQWCCLCDCGNTTIVTTHNLTTQHTQSCGCLKHMGNPTPNYKNKYIICEQFATCVVNDVQEFKFDIDDLPLVKKYHWHINTRGYVISNTLEYLHRIVMKPPLNKVVDHINGDTLDNRKCNLRICTPSNNSMNRMKQTNNTSGVIGVNFFQAYNKWRVYITVNYKTIHLGYFDSLDDAILCRKRAEEKYFGEYSLNYSRGGY